jgi:hypothetical protein
MLDLLKKVVVLQAGFPIVFGSRRGPKNLADSRFFHKKLSLLESRRSALATGTSNEDFFVIKFF